MGYKKYRLFYISLIGVALITNNFFFAKPITAFVSAGDNFHYEYEISYFNRYDYPEYEAAFLEEDSEQWDEDIHIIEIDYSYKTILYERIYNFNKDNYTTSYDWESSISNHFDFNDLFYFNYRWDQDTNKPVLSDFEFYFYYFRFVDNNWSIINTHFADLLDETRIIYTVTNPDDMSVHNITFGDFLENIKSYKIQGRSSIASAKNQFSSNTTKWTFKFDLSEYLHYRDHYNTTFDYYVYLPVDKYTYELIIEYTVDGAIKYREENFEYETTYFTDEYEVTANYNYKLSLNKLPVQLEISYLSFIPALVFIVLVVKIRNKKK